MAYGKVTEETVYTCTGHPLRSDIANILDWALNKDFTTAYNRIPDTVTARHFRYQIKVWTRRHQNDEGARMG